MGMEFNGDFEINFYLEGKGESRLGLMIENGASAFDIKEGLKRSPKAHNSGQANWYISVPFRIATAEAIAESSVFQGQMTKTVQNIAKKVGVLTVKNIPEELKIKGVRKEINEGSKTYPKYEHKFFLYEGLSRGTKKYHGQYQTFRRVSENSDENSWIHPGFQPHNFMDKTLDEVQIDNIADIAIDEFLNQNL
jgi:hypothetical protein